MGNGGYPRMDLNPEQNLKLKIFKFCFFLIFVLGSNLSQVAPFPTTDTIPKSNLD